MSSQCKIAAGALPMATRCQVRLVVPPVAAVAQCVDQRLSSRIDACCLPSSGQAERLFCCHAQSSASRSGDRDAQRTRLAIATPMASSRIWLVLAVRRSAGPGAMGRITLSPAEASCGLPCLRRNVRATALFHCWAAQRAWGPAGTKDDGR